MNIFKRLFFNMVIFIPIFTYGYFYQVSSGWLKIINWAFIWGAIKFYALCGEDSS